MQTIKKNILGFKLFVVESYIPSIIFSVPKLRAASRVRLGSGRWLRLVLRGEGRLVVLSAVLLGERVAWWLSPDSSEL